MMNNTIYVDRNLKNADILNRDLPNLRNFIEDNFSNDHYYKLKYAVQFFEKDIRAMYQEIVNCANIFYVNVPWMDEYMRFVKSQKPLQKDIQTIMKFLNEKLGDEKLPDEERIFLGIVKSEMNIIDARVKMLKEFVYVERATDYDIPTEARN